MSEVDRERMRAKLNEFTQLLETRTREFKERGDMSDEQHSLISTIKRRHDQMQDRLASAEASGTAWDVIKVEMERDFSSIYDSLAQLDDDEMKRGGR